MNHGKENAEMFDISTVNKELSAVLKADPNGETMRRYQRQLDASLDRVEGLPRGAIKDTSTKALQAGMTLLPVLWRDLNRR